MVHTCLSHLQTAIVDGEKEASPALTVAFVYLSKFAGLLGERKNIINKTSLQCLERTRN